MMMDMLMAKTLGDSPLDRGVDPTVRPFDIFLLLIKSLPQWHLCGRHG